jgi:hypothetical protein
MQQKSTLFMVQPRTAPRPARRHISRRQACHNSQLRAHRSVVRVERNDQRRRLRGERYGVFASASQVNSHQKTLNLALIGILYSDSRVFRAFFPQYRLTTASDRSRHYGLPSQLVLVSALSSRWHGCHRLAPDQSLPDRGYGNGRRAALRLRLPFGAFGEADRMECTSDELGFPE